MTRRIAGELVHQEIGKTVEVGFSNGNVTSTVKDVIEKIVHEAGGVRIHFRGTKWYAQKSFLLDPVDQGLLVAPNSYVIIMDD